MTPTAREEIKTGLIDLEKAFARKNPGVAIQMVDWSA
jgi:hypothetical protein